MIKDSDLKIKRFKDGSSSWWVGNLHYNLNELNEICFIAGGIDTKNHRDVLEKYIKRTKSVFVPREPSIFENEPKEYLTISYGKYNGKPLNEIVDIDKRYAKWLYETAEKGIKEQLKELLKLK